MKSITLLLMLAISTSLFSQQTTADRKTNYQHKSKIQKTVALILLGGGATLVLTDILIPRGEVIHEGFWDSYKNDGIKTTFGLTGIVSMLGSIPFFIASSKNKRKAASVSIYNEKIQTLQKGSFAYNFVPAVRLTIRL